MNKATNGSRKRCNRLTTWLLLLSALGMASVAPAADSPSPTPYQAKATCIFNFAKYMNWPADTFAASNSPITIGVSGDARMLDQLKSESAGKLIEGHPIEVVVADAETNWSRCQIIFVAGSSRRRQTAVLNSVNSKPILTVGENNQFIPRGGIINVVTKDDKVRFDINADAAHRSGLRISSRIMSLADNITGDRGK